MSKRAEQAANEIYKDGIELFGRRDRNGNLIIHPEIMIGILQNACQRGYEQAEKDLIALVKQYIEKGERCMEQEGESQIYAFWSGFHNCAENILRELEEE